MTLLAIAAVLGGALLGLTAPHAVLIALTSAAVLAGCVALWWRGGVTPLALPPLTFVMLAAHQCAFMATAAAGIRVRGRARDAADGPALANAAQDDQAEDLARAARQLASMASQMRETGGEQPERKSA